MIGIAGCLGAKVCDGVLEGRVEAPAGENGERGVRAAHRLDGMEHVVERRGPLCVAQLLGGKAVRPVEGADRVYCEDGDVLVWHVGCMVRGEMRDRGGEVGKGRRTEHVHAGEALAGVGGRHAGAEKAAEALDVEGGVRVVNDGGDLGVCGGGEERDEDVVEQLGLARRGGAFDRDHVAAMEGGQGGDRGERGCGR